MMLVTIAHNLDILGSHQGLVAILVSSRIGLGGRSGDDLEMVAAKAGNYTLVMVDEIDSRVA